MSRSVILSLVCSLALQCVVGADLVDISSQAWTAGDTSHTATSTGGVDVDFNFSGTLSTSPQPATSPDPGTATPYIQSGVNGFDGGLVWRFSEVVGVSHTDVVSLEIAFNGTQADNVSFVLGDIDTGSDAGTGGANFDNWQDIVVVKGLDSGGNDVAPGVNLLGGAGTSVLEDSSSLYAPLGDPAVTLFGVDGPTAASDTRGNVEISFATAISKILIDYRPGLSTSSVMSDFILGFGPDTTTSQFISLHDINFTAVPEPSSFALIGLVGLGFGMRRRQAILSWVKSFWV